MRTFAVAAIAALLTPAVLAQTPVSLVAEGVDLPGVPGTLVLGIDSPAVNSVGGYGSGLRLDDGTATFDVVWGTFDGVAAPAVLVTQGTSQGFTQGAFEFNVGIGAQGFAVYSSVLDPGSLDSVWANDFIVAKEGDAIPGLAGKVFRFASRPGVTDNAEPVFVGGINDASGTIEGNGLFKGFVPTAVLKSGDAVPGLPLPLASGSAIDFDFRFSPDGAHYIVAVDMEGASAADDIAIVYDGAGLTIGGALVRELTLLPAAQQVDPAEAWDNFDSFGVADDGSYMFTGDTDGPTATDEFIVVDGEIVLREGDAAGAFVLTGSMEGAAYSAIKDVAATWDVEDGAGGSLEAVLFNGRVVALEGDEADVDLDGAPEAGSAISGFTGIAAIAVGSDRAVYVTADVDTAGTSTTTDDVEVLLRIPVRELEASADSVSLSTGGTVDFTLFTPRDVPVDLYLLLGSASGTAPGLPVAGFNLPLNLDAYLTYTLANPNSAFLPGSFAAPDALGVGDAQLVVPAATDPGLAGVTVSHAYASLALFPAPAVTGTSNAVDVTLAP